VQVMRHRADLLAQLPDIPAVPSENANPGIILDDRVELSFSSVVLPEPFGPRIAIRCCCGIVRFRSAKTRVSPRQMVALWNSISAGSDTVQDFRFLCSDVPAARTCAQ
jgi:hypothetical protein